MPREIKNDRLSQDQLMELVRKKVKQEIRRRDGAVAASPAIPTNAQRTRFICPWRSGPTASSQNITTATILFLLVAGAKDLHIKRIALGAGDDLAAGTGTVAQALSMCRFWNANLVVTSTAAGSHDAVPICLNNRNALSSARFTISSAAPNVLTTTAQFTIDNARICEDMAIVSVMARNNGAIKRWPVFIEQREEDDSDLLIIPSGTGLMINTRIASASQGNTWPCGCIEWEE